MPITLHRVISMIFSRLLWSSLLQRSLCISLNSRSFPFKSFFQIVSLLYSSEPYSTSNFSKLIICSVFEHDSSRVAICRSYLQNRCNDVKCLLSHSLQPVSNHIERIIYAILLPFLTCVLYFVQF